MKVSVIIPTRNRAKLLRHCIDKLLSQTRLPDEIIIVDDASTDNTQELISHLASHIPHLKYIRFPKRKGHWYARNVAVKAAKGELIVFVDSDVLVDKNFIHDHLGLHQMNQKIAVQGLVRHIRRPESFGCRTLRIDGVCFTGLVIQNCSIRKKLLIEAGLFNEHPLMGYMDVELGMRLSRLGVKKVYAFRRCSAYHVDGYPTRERLGNLFLKFRERGKTSIHFIQRAKGKSTERFSNLKVLFISCLLQTEKWAEKEKINTLLLRNVDSPFFFIFPVLKEIMKYHYRARGIKEASAVAQDIASQATLLQME